MDKITRNLFDIPIEDFTLTKVCSVKSSAEANDSIQVTLRVKYSGVTINQLAQATLGQGVVVKWQNGQGRKKHGSLKKGQVVDVDFKAPGAAQVDPMEAIILRAKAEGVDVSDTKALMAFIEKEIAKR